jgi:hypothetical protein
MPEVSTMARLTTYLFTLVIIELAIGGGGRLTAFGPVTLRMALFGLAITTSIIYFVKGKRIKKEYAILILAFILLSVIGLLRGISAGASRTFWWEDIRPLLYFFILPFFSFAVQDEKSTHLTASIFKGSGIFLSLCFFLVLFVIHSGILPFLTFYKSVIDTQEFFFRGELTFFYKGFLFLCIGFLFFYFTEGRYRIIAMLVIGVAIFFTVTRGFWFAMFATFAAFYFFKSKLKFQTVLLALLALAVIFIGQTVISETSQVIHAIKKQNNIPTDELRKSALLGDRSYSDEGRLQQVKEVVQEVTIPSSLIGHGLGVGIPSRPVHMEIAYLEIFHKQGLLGAVFWLYVFYLLLMKYRNSKMDGLCHAFFFCGLFVFIQSLTNQYVNNPIGLSVVLLSIVCLDVYKK